MFLRMYEQIHQIECKMTQDRIKALEDALRIKATMIELGEKIAWGSDVALMREAADALAASRAASDCHQPDLVTADSSQPAQPVAVKRLSQREIAEIIRKNEVADMTKDGDRRWVNRMAEALCERQYSTPQPLTVQDAARRILSDDIAISHMARAIHDGP